MRDATSRIQTAARERVARDRDHDALEMPRSTGVLRDRGRTGVRLAANGIVMIEASVGRGKRISFAAMPPTVDTPINMGGIDAAGAFEVDPRIVATMRALVAYCHEVADRSFMTRLFMMFARDPPRVFVSSFSCDATTAKLTLPMRGLDDDRNPPNKYHTQSVHTNTF